LPEEIDWDVMAKKSSSLISPVYGRITGLLMLDIQGEGRVNYDLIRASLNTSSITNPT
jgi:hypothetical protein